MSCATAAELGRGIFNRWRFREPWPRASNPRRPEAATNPSASPSCPTRTCGRSEARRRAWHGRSTASGAGPQPEFIVTGGDLIHNCRDLTIDQGEKMADLFASIWNDHTDLPTYHCIGNHDPLGWRNEEVPQNHPLIAFGLFREKLGLTKTYHSFDRGGWHFVVLQNFSLTERGKYVSEFTDEQMNWLCDDLRKIGGKPTPSLIA